MEKKIVMWKPPPVDQRCECCGISGKLDESYRKNETFIELHWVCNECKQLPDLDFWKRYYYK